MLKKNLILILFSLTAFIHAEFTPNQSAVLLELQSESGHFILDKLSFLEHQHLQHPLNQLSGEQFTSLAVASELTGTYFLRSLYNPIRLQVITSPCLYTCCCAPVVELWLQGGGGQSFINNCKHADNTVSNNYAISVGAQSINKCWTLGTAASFTESKLDYQHDGNGKSRFAFAGLYGLYRPIGYYVIADLIYGRGKRDLKRSIHIHDLHFFSFSNPKNSQWLGYLEAGLDHIMCNLLVQPFFGFEGHAFFNERIREKGSALNLNVCKHNEGDVYSRLGAHITMDLCLCLLSLDLVWKYHLNPSHHRITVKFQHFGKKFHIKDVKRGQSFFEGALALTTKRRQGFDFFAEVFGIVGYHSASYQALAGLEYAW